MPTYAYACTTCEHSFDFVQSFSDDPLTVCPECDGRLRKVYGSIGVSFKGPGFYRTDSRSDKKSSTVNNGSSESSGKSASPAVKSGSSGSSGTGGSSDSGSGSGSGAPSVGSGAGKASSAAKVG
ncbi:MAG: FmdB family transcriptional regulator [Actinomycetales bacterium]|nr:FmdB family transcriptional regulator [Actinomycetales bacterium]